MMKNEYIIKLPDDLVGNELNLVLDEIRDCGCDEIRFYIPETDGENDG